MRILHIAQSVSGGIASYLDEIAGYQTQLFGEGAVRFLIPANSCHHLQFIGRAQIAEFSPYDRTVRGLLAMSLAAHREMKNFAPTIVHLHSTFAGAVVRPIVILQGRTRRVVYCAHGWVFGMEVAPWKRRLFSMIERGLVPLTDLIINISHSEHELARLNGISSRKMLTIRNGIRALPPSNFGSRNEFRQDTIHLIFVGRHDRQKGLDYLLDAFVAESVPSVHLHVVGAPVLECRNTIPTNELSNVTFYGWQTRDVVSELISNADALIMPSRWEGFGLVALEAMRLGKPVLASRRGGLIEIVEHGRTGLHFDMDRPSELREVLRNLDKKVLAEMGRIARSEFLRLFTSDRLNKELVAAYRSLLEAKNHTGLLGWRARKTEAH